MRLGELLVKAGVATESQIAMARREQDRTGQKLGQVLVSMGVLPEDLLLKALSRLLQVPFVGTDIVNVPPQVLSRLSKENCYAWVAVPIQYVPERLSLVVAMADPMNLQARDAMARLLGMRIEVCLASERKIYEAIDRLYGALDSALPAATRIDAEWQSLMMPLPNSSLPQGMLVDLMRQHVRMVRALCSLLFERGILSAEDAQALSQRILQGMRNFEGLPPR